MLLLIKYFLNICKEYGEEILIKNPTIDRDSLALAIAKKWQKNYKYVPIIGYLFKQVVKELERRIDKERVEINAEIFKVFKR